MNIDSNSYVAVVYPTVHIVYRSDTVNHLTVRIV